MSSESAPQDLEAAERPVALEVDLSIAGVAALKRRLDEALGAGAPVIVEGGRVERVDAASLQLLAAFSREAGTRGLSVHWRGVSVPLSEAAAAVGLVEALGLAQQEERDP